MVRTSAVLREVNTVMPTSAKTALRTFNNVVGSSFFPTYLEPFAPERIVNVSPAPSRLLRDPDVERARDSVFKLRGNNACGRGVEGTGFVYAAHRLMTNAHVVAGVRKPKIVVGDRLQPATVVYYNPDIDVAVLAVPDIEAAGLRFDTGGRTRDAAAALGYPQDGPFNAQPMRIRAEQRLKSADIYGLDDVTREVFSLRGVIRPGNSGGPLVASSGQVYGVVFAASVSDKDTGYALTASQVSRAATLGIGATRPVSTRGCA
jgi:S1-C subfamily serine protease